MNNNINNQPNSIFDQYNGNIVDESFSIDYADTFQKQMQLEDNNLNETVLEQKYRNAQQGNQNQNQYNNYFMNQYQNINCIEDDLNITIQDRKKDDYLEMRKLPKYSEKEFLDVKKSVGNGLLQIQDYLLIKLKEYNAFNINKKVGPLLPLSYLVENHYRFKKENKKQMQEKYNRFKNYIYNFRPIYRDGNCFYRSVMFRYIELLIIYRKTDFIKSLIIDMYKSFKSNEIRNRLYIQKDYLNPNLIIQVMLTILELTENNRILEAHFAFYKAILFSKIFDYSLILYLRYILYTYIKENEKKLYLESFPILIGNLLPLQYEKDGNFNFAAFYNNNLLKMFISPEKIVIYLIPFVLGINLKIILFDDKENEVVKNFDFAGISELNVQDSIFLIYRRSGFENIYTYEENCSNSFINKYYRNDCKPSFVKVDKSLPIPKESTKAINNQNLQQKIPNSIYGTQILQHNKNNSNNNNINRSQVIPNSYNTQNNPFYNNNYQNNNQMTYNNNTMYYPNNQNQNMCFGNNMTNNNPNYNQYNNNSYNNNNCNNFNNNYNNNNYNNNYNNNNYNNNNYNNNCEIQNNNNNGPQFGFENPNDKSYEAFTYYNGKYTYKDDQQQNQNNFQQNTTLFGNSQNIPQNFNNNNPNNMNNNNYNNNNFNNMNNNNFNNNNNNNNSQLSCNKCSSIHQGLKKINSICPDCFMGEIINQSKPFYINYLKSVTVLEKANSVTKKDLENLFLQKVIINFENKKYNIFQAIDEFNCPKINSKFDFNQILKNILLAIKSQICLYCCGPVQNTEFQLPCGCCFCSYYHLNLFMNEKVQTNITYNYKCFCSFKYKPNKVNEFCNFLFNKQVYKNYNFLIESLNAIFCRICFKCGCEKKGLHFADIDGLCPNKFNHFICEDCIKKENSNCVECVICKTQHKFMIKDF